MKVKKKCLAVTISILLLAFYACSESTTPQEEDETNTGSESWELVWSDEFEYNGLPDSTRWSYDIGGHGWGNGELQYYRDGSQINSFVDGENLIITARKETFGGSSYTSARLVSREKGDWLYGRVEVRATLPSGRGTWPAIWMLPTDWVYGGWPASGEIDIMEHVGYDPAVVHASIHTEAYNHSIGTQVSSQTVVSDYNTVFHTYGLEWTADSIKVSLDDEVYFSFEREATGHQTWPFDQRFHLIMNIAVGGSWGGVQGVDDTIFPQSMLVDYVRVYQLSE